MFHVASKRSAVFGWGRSMLHRRMNDNDGRQRGVSNGTCRALFADNIRSSCNWEKGTSMRKSWITVLGTLFVSWGISTAAAQGPPPPIPGGGGAPGGFPTAPGAGGLPATPGGGGLPAAP